MCVRVQLCTLTSKFTLLGRLSSIFHLTVSPLSLLLLSAMSLPSLSLAIFCAFDAASASAEWIRHVCRTLVMCTERCKGGVTLRAQLEEKSLGVADFSLTFHSRSMYEGYMDGRVCVCACTCANVGCARLQSNVCKQK